MTTTVEVIKRLLAEAESPQERKVLIGTLESLLQQRFKATFQEAVTDLLDFKRDSERETPLFTEMGLYDLLGKDDARSVLVRVGTIAGLADLDEDGDQRAEHAAYEQRMKEAAFSFAHYYGSAVNRESSSERIETEWQRYSGFMTYKMDDPEYVARLRARWESENWPTLEQLQRRILDAYNDRP